MAKDPCKPNKPPIPLIAPTLPPSEVERVKVASPPATALTAPAGVIQDLLPPTQQAVSPREIAAAARTVEAAAASLATAAAGKATAVAIAATSVEKAAAALAATTAAVREQQLRLPSHVMAQPLSQSAQAIPLLSQPSPATLPLSQLSLVQSGIAAMAVASPDTPPMCIETTCSEKPYTNSRDMSATRAGIPSQPKTHTLFKYETPDHWAVQHNFEDKVKIVELDLRHGEGQRIACLFGKSFWGKTVVGIQRIQNLMLWNKYCTKREEIRSMLGRMTKREERTLFHGTSPQNVEAICHSGFDPRLSGENGVKFGHGSYFARDASYCRTYCGPDPWGIQYMFVATVVVGDYVEGKRDYRRPPSKIPGIERPVRPCDFYCSCVNKRDNPTVFVIFDTAQAYPQYVINYS
ncbi:PREDICTED: poly [ADP-ribose] polymerase 12-like [Priapulus caudatus]|uniref:Poly [ADP-ribose] polymerase n=1 Tax=Priapulus caudatus TaxID=37621 RepID=A0ABM1F2A2_PRICU|nr:PREDICTED: poly [ADP-ribose] polymerase 12-like [Priapulus caudatus]XP_014678573.1 PREDICTED: poly [ADP-ribose] polymerase 12-like [Priapulus caudatus]